MLGYPFWHVTASDDATVCPQLAKADAASRAHPLLNPLKLAWRRRIIRSGGASDGGMVVAMHGAAGCSAWSNGRQPAIHAARVTVTSRMRAASPSGANPWTGHAVHDLVIAMGASRS